MLPLVIWIGFERVRDAANLTWVLISVAPPLITVVFALAPIVTVHENIMHNALDSNLRYRPK